MEIRDAFELYENRIKIRIGIGGSQRPYLAVLGASILYN